MIDTNILIAYTFLLKYNICYSEKKKKIQAYTGYAFKLTFQALSLDILFLSYVDVQ